MGTMTWGRLGGMASAAVLAVALGGPALAQGGHDHGAGTPQRLQLDHGKKWATDAALRDGMSRLRALLAPRIDDAHAGRLDAAAYGRLAEATEAEVARIVAECKLSAQADAMLHLVIADLAAGADIMAGRGAPGTPPEAGLVRAVQAVNGYAGHFAHRGFKAIPLHD